ncbi:MAG TPA: hypothetical protein PKD61_03710 [Polyangiaceae bacterium]|mgnify:CR=1 FL=1|nr:hypothetical protein [Polyangiaceae bacterium]
MRVVLFFAGALCLAACSGDQDSTPGTASGGTGGTGTGGTGASVADSSFPSGGSGGTPQPCDAGFVLTPDPPTTGSVLRVAFTDSQPLTYVDVRVTGPSTPTVTGAGITTKAPWTWNWDVVGLGAGLHTFEFWAGEPQEKRASCVRMVADTGPAPDAGSGGSSGSGGGGGAGGHCCKIVGTQLKNPSPCGPSASSSPWQTLDNAGCNAAGCQKIWCPFEKCDAAKYPGGCPSGTEACFINDSFSSYEDACQSCCQGFGACWDPNLSMCRHPNECGKPLWQCPWQ